MEVLPLGGWTEKRSGGAVAAAVTADVKGGISLTQIRKKYQGAYWFCFSFFKGFSIPSLHVNWGEIEDRFINKATRLHLSR